MADEFEDDTGLMSSEDEADLEEEVVDDEVDFLKKKEAIASIIFDYDYVAPEQRPTEDTCHELAVLILDWIAAQEDLEI